MLRRGAILELWIYDTLALGYFDVYESGRLIRWHGGEFGWVGGKYVLIHTSDIIGFCTGFARGLGEGRS